MQAILYNLRRSVVLPALILIMIPALQNNNRIIFELINQAMLVVNTPGPEAEQVLSNCLRLPGALKWRPGYLLNQTINLFEH